MLWNVMQGGVHNRLESVAKLGPRSSFFRTDFMENGLILPTFAADARAAKLLSALRDSEALNVAAKRLFNSSHVRPYAIYGNMLLPGQELPLHTDVPAYRGINRGVLATHRNVRW